MTDFWDKQVPPFTGHDSQGDEAQSYWEQSIESITPPSGSLSFGTDIKTGQRVYVTPDDLAVHSQFIGRSGKGKSFGLEAWIRHHLLAPNMPGVVVLDPGGDLYRRLVAFCAANSHRNNIGQRLVLFDPGRTDYIIGYNPLRRDRRSLDGKALMLFEVFNRVCMQDDFTQTPRLARWFYNALLLLLSGPATLLEAEDVLDPKPNAVRRLLVDELQESLFLPRVKGEWEWFEQQKPTLREERTESSLSRIRFFLGRQEFNRIFSQQAVTLDFDALLDQGGILLVNLEAYNTNSAIGKNGARLLGTMLINDILGAAFSRQTGRRRPCYLYADEFGEFATRDLALILDTGRKYGLHLILAHQYLEQLKTMDEQLYFSVLTNTANKVIFGGLTVPDARIMADEVFTPELDLDERKLEIHRTYFEPHESTRTVVTENWAEAVSSAEASSFADAYVSGGTDGFATMTFSDALVPSYAVTSSRGHSFNSSAMSGSTSMQGTSTMSGGARSLVPFYELMESSELSSVQFRGYEEQIIRAVQELKRQPQQHAVFSKMIGQERSQFIRFDTLRDPSVPDTFVDSFVHQLLSESPLYSTPEQVENERLNYLDELHQRMRHLGEIETRATIEVQPSMPDTSLSTSPTTKVGNMELQERDIAILKDVFDTRFITIEHAADLHFQDLKSAAASAKRRLSKLAENGLLKPQDVPLKRAKKVYRLTKQGLDILIERGILRQLAGEEWDAKLRKRYTDTISPAILEHEIGMLDIKVAVNAAIAEQAHLKVIDFGIWPLQYKFPVQRDGRTVDQHPDGFLHIAEFRPNEDHPRNHYFYVELDRGTETLYIVAQKADGYRQHLRDGGFGQAIGRPDAPKKDRTFRVLFVVDTKDASHRRRNICQRLSDDGIQTHALVATLAEVRKDPLSAIWLTPQAHKAWIESGGKQAPQKEPLLGD